MKYILWGFLFFSFHLQSAVAQSQVTTGPDSAIKVDACVAKYYQETSSIEYKSEAEIDALVSNMIKEVMAIDYNRVIYAKAELAQKVALDVQKLEWQVDSYDRTKHKRLRKSDYVWAALWLVAAVYCIKSTLSMKKRRDEEWQEYVWLTEKYPSQYRDLESAGRNVFGGYVWYNSQDSRGVKRMIELWKKGFESPVVGGVFLTSFCGLFAYMSLRMWHPLPAVDPTQRLEKMRYLQQKL